MKPEEFLEKYKDQMSDQMIADYVVMIEQMERQEQPRKNTTK